jgi:IS30 family transposase
MMAKNTSFVIGDHFTEIQDIVMTANLTPRKRLGFKAPFQAILKKLGKDVKTRFA